MENPQRRGLSKLPQPPTTTFAARILHTKPPTLNPDWRRLIAATRDAETQRLVDIQLCAIRRPCRKQRHPVFGWCVVSAIIDLRREMGVTDHPPGSPTGPEKRNAERRTQFSEWVQKCRDAGEPLCFETGQPIAGKNIYRDDLGFAGYTFGQWHCNSRFVPVIGEVGDKWEERGPTRLSKRRVTTCPNCGSRRLNKHERSNSSACCTGFCQQQLKKTKEREKRRPEPRECHQCGETFEPRRKDSKFCTSACKQKAYRRRVTDSAPTGDSGRVMRNGVRS